MFYASEEARLLHVLLDARITNARRHHSRSRDRGDLDRELLCSWDTFIAPLFNDDFFSPQANEMVCHGTTATGIADYIRRGESMFVTRTRLLRNGQS
jgi:hypothetical protein